MEVFVQNKNLFLFLLVPLFLMSTSYSISTSLNATVTINCPFTLNISSENIFLLYNNLNFTYTANTSKDCKINNINGILYIWRTNQTESSAFIGNTITIYNITQKPKNYTIYINKSKLSSGTYYANVSSYKKFYPEITNGPILFQTIYPPIISIENMIYSNTINQFSPLAISYNIQNTGNLSVSNSTYLNILIKNNNTTIKQKYKLGSILSNSNITKILSLSSITNKTGTYKILENITYSYLYTFKNKTYLFTGITQNYTFNVTVVSNINLVSYPGSSPSPVKVTTLPVPPSLVANVSYLSTPEYITMLPNQNYLYSLNLYNNFQKPVWVNITIPKINGLTLSLSSKNIYLLPNQSITSHLSIYATNPNQSTYTIPIIENITDFSYKSIIYTQYILLNVENIKKQNPNILNTIISLNNSKDILGTITILNNKNTTIFNATGTLILPSLITNNSKNIILSGYQGSVNTSKNYYILNWNIPVLIKNSSAVLYYYIKNVSNIMVSEQPTVAFSTPSKQSNSSTLKIFNLEIPTLYTNESSQINFTMLYTGPGINNITVSLSPILGLNIANNPQSFSVFQNTEINSNFNIGANSRSGTYLMTLYLSGKGINENYTFNLIVLPEQKPLIVPQLNNESKGPATIQSNIINYYTYGVVLAILIIASIITYKRFNISRYNQYRSQKLKRIGEQIKRGE
ncbi:MAG: hypothetical protein ACP5M9_03250 [Candidatus Micrarchaeia archaeon]